MDDEDLWDHITRDVKPLAGRTVKPREEAQKQAPKVKPKSPRVENLVRTPLPQKPEQSSEIDHRTNERLRKGQMPIDATLDLHGLKQDEAHHALQNFILNAHRNENRCVLVITGKGQKNRDPLAPKMGIIKQRVPEWLGDAPLKPLILRTHPARPKHGGDGALYILLRRQR